MIPLYGTRGIVSAASIVALAFLLTFLLPSDSDEPSDLPAPLGTGRPIGSGSKAPPPPVRLKGQGPLPVDKPPSMPQPGSSTREQRSAGSRAFAAFRRRDWQAGIEALRRAQVEAKSVSLREEFRIRLVIALLEHGSAEEASRAVMSFLADGAKFAQLPGRVSRIYFRSFLRASMLLSAEATSGVSLHQRITTYYYGMGVRRGSTVGGGALLTERIKTRLVDRFSRDPARATEYAAVLAAHRFLEINLRIGVPANKPDLAVIKSEVVGFVTAHEHAKDAQVVALCGYFRRVFSEFWSGVPVDSRSR